MTCWARDLFLALVAVLALGHVLAACGQKGPLYLPDEAPPAEARPAAGPAATPTPPPDDLPPAR